MACAHPNSTLAWSRGQHGQGTFHCRQSGYKESVSSNESHAVPLALRARECFYCTSVAHKDSLLNTVKYPNWCRAAAAVVQKGCLAGCSCLLDVSRLIPCPLCCLGDTKEAEDAGGCKSRGFPRHRDFLLVSPKPTPVAPRVPLWRRDSEVAKPWHAATHLLADGANGLRASWKGL